MIVYFLQPTRLHCTILPGLVYRRMSTVDCMPHTRHRTLFTAIENSLVFDDAATQKAHVELLIDNSCAAVKIRFFLQENTSRTVRTPFESSSGDSSCGWVGGTGQARVRPPGTARVQVQPPPPQREATSLTRRGYAGYRTRCWEGVLYNRARGPRRVSEMEATIRGTVTTITVI
jgi:hypothetical protein